MTIKEEFEKDFKKEFGRSMDFFDVLNGEADSKGKDIALWAAKWMAERICQERFGCLFDGCVEAHVQVEKIRQLAKELQ